MSDPREPKREVPLSDADFELIRSTDFRVNNVMTAIMGEFEIALQSGRMRWSNEKLKAFQQFIWNRVQAIEANQPAFDSSSNPLVRLLGVGNSEITQQLMSVAGAIGLYLRNGDIHWCHESLRDSYERMKTSLRLFGSNRAYQAYRVRMPEENRTTFVYEDSSGGE